MLLIVLSIVGAVRGQDPVVRTIYGEVQGTAAVTADGYAYEMYKGIPFATPPEGDLRWQKPVPPEVWHGILVTQNYGKSCTEIVSVTSNEDCLYLNVWVPGSHQDHLADPLPVIAYVHGGAFVLGNGNKDCSDVTTKGGIIMVTMNYRLGNIGFLSTMTDTAPGDYGLWDQIASLQWIQDNIAAFGGDPTRVTIMGHSAGSASVSHLALAPPARGLFHRVLAVSGSSASYWALSRHQRLATYQMAEHYNCSTASDQEVVDCLRGEKANSVNLWGIIIPPIQDGYVMTQLPVVDQDLVSVLPIDGMSGGLNMDYDMLVGRTHDDAAWFVLPFTITLNLMNFYIVAVFYPYSNWEELVALVKDRYPMAFSEDLDTRQFGAVKLMTDFCFGSRAEIEMAYHSQFSEGTGKSTYLYEFKYQYTDTNPPWLQGVHGEDLAFFFGRSSFNAEQSLLNYYVRSYYCNYAYTGNPNEGPHPMILEWPQFNNDTKMQLVENPDIYTEPLSQEFQDRYNFWNNIYSMMIPREDYVPFDELEVPPEANLAMWEVMRRYMEIEKSY